MVANGSGQRIGAPTTAEHLIAVTVNYRHLRPSNFNAKAIGARALRHARQSDFCAVLFAHDPRDGAVRHGCDPHMAREKMSEMALRGEPKIETDLGYRGL